MVKSTIHLFYYLKKNYNYKQFSVKSLVLWSGAQKFSPAYNHSKIVYNAMVCKLTHKKCVI